MLRTKIAAGILFFIILILTANSFASRGFVGSSGNYYPAPELWYPVTQDIDLSGRVSLQFKWRRVDQTKTAYYEFKLYKGYDTLASTLILKEKIPNGKYPFELSAENLETNQVYTWSLRQIYWDGAKTSAAYSSFKITKR